MVDVVVTLEVEGIITLDMFGMTIITPQKIMDMVVLILVGLGVAIALVLAALVPVGVEIPMQTRII